MHIMTWQTNWQKVLYSEEMTKIRVLTFYSHILNIIVTVYSRILCRINLSVMGISGKGCG